MGCFPCLEMLGGGEGHHKCIYVYVLDKKKEQAGSRSSALSPAGNIIFES